MRFHFGVSFRPTKILKYIGLGFLGLLAFFGISKYAKADSITYSSIQVNNANNGIVLSCPPNSASVCPNNDINIVGTEYIGRYFLINFDNTILTNGHNYSFDITWVIVHPASDTAFEQESFLMYQTGSANALNDTTIVWDYSTRYDWDYDRFYTSYTYSGQFTATSNSSLYANLKMENNESFYGIGVGLIHLVDNSSGDELINANYQNTQNIINNANSNTTSIINNQNSNTQEIKDTINDNLQECHQSINLLDLSNVTSTGTKNGVTYTINNDGGITIIGTPTDYTSWYLKGLNLSPGVYVASQFPNTKPNVFIQSLGNISFVSQTNQPFTLDVSSNGALYLVVNRSLVNTNVNTTFYPMVSKGFTIPTEFEPYGVEICKNRIDSLNNSIKDTNQSIQELNDTISDDSIDTTTSNDFFDNFEDNHHGLSGIVSLPLTTIQSLNNASCSPLTLTIPYLQSNNTLQLPCLTPIYQNNFGVFFTLYQTIIFGFVSYYVCVSVFYMVKDFKDPNKDKIEVMDL